MANIVDAADETAAPRWRDPAGRVHAVDGAEVLLGEVLRWTRCGLYDLPAGEGWSGDEQPTCAACRIWADMDPSPWALAAFGVVRGAWGEDFRRKGNLEAKITQITVPATARPVSVMGTRSLIQSPRRRRARAAVGIIANTGASNKLRLDNLRMTCPIYRALPVPA